MRILSKNRFISFHMIAKRIFDLIFSICGLILLFLPMLILWVLIHIFMPGPAIYRQERLGLHGRPFILLKFRTMTLNAEASGIQMTQVNDPRITPFGRFLRRFHIDELPQLVNILRGEMSLVGPRPERAYFYNQYAKTVPGFSRRLEVLPGLTGWAQVNGGYDLKPEEKLRYDMEYIRDQSLLLDIKCILLTAKTLLTGEGSR